MEMSFRLLLRSKKKKEEYSNILKGHHSSLGKYKHIQTKRERAMMIPYAVFI